MKGLMYKDIVIDKADIIGAAFVVVYFAAWMLLVNSVDGLEQENLSIVSTTVAGGIFAMNFALPSIALNCGNEDSKTKWNIYAMALPGGYKRMLLEKYLIGFIGQILAAVISLIAIFVCGEVYALPEKFFIMHLLLCAGLMLIAQAILLPVILRGKTGIVQILVIGFIISVLLCGAAYLAFGNIDFLTKDHLLERLLAWIVTNRKRIWLMLYGLVAAGVLLEVLSYRLTVFLYSRD